MSLSLLYILSYARYTKIVCSSPFDSHERSPINIHLLGFEGFCFSFIWAYDVVAAAFKTSYVRVVSKLRARVGWRIALIGTSMIWWKFTTGRTTNAANLHFVASNDAGTDNATHSIGTWKISCIVMIPEQLGWPAHHGKQLAEVTVYFISNIGKQQSCNVAAFVPLEEKNSFAGGKTVDETISNHSYNVSNSDDMDDLYALLFDEVIDQTFAPEPAEYTLLTLLDNFNVSDDANFDFLINHSLWRYDKRVQNSSVLGPVGILVDLIEMFFPTENYPLTYFRNIAKHEGVILIGPESISNGKSHFSLQNAVKL
ncbi:hypothetical protein MA16_Dca024571 [Dendrobium catenatum]|uniref:Uncharacterized protein n=1 Tax=Dendrobium catenatum TaxID=906689 RepID=A0A2I0X5K6_9ASPA|nr:hypothetical protein MA16_Dca024571 [Dendrobium catenatum]